MHPELIQTIAAERSRNLQECAAACRRTEEIRRSRRTEEIRRGRRSPHPRPFLRLARAVPGLRLRAA